MNVSRAAEALNISQSALSRQIQSLEEELGCRLFDRIGKRLSLTLEGEHLLPRAAQLLDQADALSLRSEAVARGQFGHLRIGATAQTIASLIAPALTIFRKTHPAVEVSLIEAPNRTLVEMVERGAVHVSVATPDDPGAFYLEPLFVARLLAYLPSGDHRRSASELPIESLADAPVLLLRRGFMTRDLFDESCRTAGVRARIVLESDSPHALIAMVEAGHGIAMLSSSAARGVRTSPPISVSLAKDFIQRQVSAIWSPLRHRPAALAPFILSLKQTLGSDTLPFETSNTSGPQK
ncbi:LysR family transcriptional regulator [Labrys sp. KNU-23]|nr:LysR family transcriptional regulator [Labrys sp. KNU-23]